MAVNKRRISLREGKMYLDGYEVAENIKLTANFTPDVSESRVLGERSLSRRWLGYDITGSITQYRSTPWLRQAIDKYIQNGSTPEFTITGIQDDKNSDYYDANGTITATLSGVVLTGDIPLINLDSEGDLMKDEIEFGAHDLA